MLISPFTPLFFGTRKSDGIESRYIQTFASTDQILVQMFVDPDTDVKLFIVNDDNDDVFELTCNEYTVNSGTKMVFTTITGLSNGYYRAFIPSYTIAGVVEVTPNLNIPMLSYEFTDSAPEKLIDVNKEMVIKGVRYAGVESDIFRVTNDKTELAKTTLIQYSMKDNKQRTDALFIVDGMRYFFDFRVPGGFKDSGWVFAVDNEQFLTPDADPVEMYALESTQKKFTMGGQEGVPVVFGELLNRLLTCTYVYFDGVRYARKDSSVPEMQVPMEGLDSFVFAQLLQRVNNLNPTIENSNYLVMRRVDSTYGRITAQNINRKIYK